MSSLSLSRSLFGVAVNRTSIGPQACLTLCDPMDGSPPGSSVHGFSQARILDEVGVEVERRKRKHLVNGNGEGHPAGIPRTGWF